MLVPGPKPGGDSFFSTLTLEASDVLLSPYVGWAHTMQSNPPLHSGSTLNQETPRGGSQGSWALTLTP